MDRRFQDINEDQFPKIEQLLEHGYAPNPSLWADLLTAHRILVLGDAGSGKTFECQRQAELLWAQGEPAFFLELADLAHREVPSMLSPDQIKRLEAWRRSDAGLATFFLDSFDELKLTGGVFRLALASLARAVEGQLGRIRVIVTTRPIPFDRREVERTLPIPPQPSGEAFANLATEGRSSREDRLGPPAWRTVLLLHLTMMEAHQLALSQGVEDVDALLSDVQSRNAEEYVRRPQDLIELCARWNASRDESSHQRDVEYNVRHKLQVSAQRIEPAGLSIRRALEGAEALALTALLAKNLRIRQEGASPAEGVGALDAGQILDNWLPAERATLLQRALFSFASYGELRFHHRSALEYLAARAIDTLLKSGLSQRAATRLLFGTASDGRRVLRPSMRPVAAWLSLSQAFVLEWLLRIEPSTLLDFGDPASLTPDVRVRVLNAYIVKHGGGGRRGRHSHGIQIKRFTHPALADEIIRAWTEGIKNPEIRRLLLELVEEGRLPGCSDIAYRAAADLNEDDSVRLQALEVLVSLSDSRLDNLAKMTAENDDSNEELRAIFVARLYPNWMTLPQLVSLAERHSLEGAEDDRIGRWLADSVRNAQFGLGELEDFVHAMLALVGPLRLDDEGAFTAQRPSLAQCVAAGCLVALQSSSIFTVIEPIAFVAAVRIRSRAHDREWLGELKAGLSRAPVRLRESIFLSDLKVSLDLRKYTEPWHVFWESFTEGPIGIGESDRDWVLALIAPGILAAQQRAVMLEAAIHLRPLGSEREEYVDRLSELVADDKELVAALVLRLAPSTLDASHLRMLEQQEEQRKNVRVKQAQVRERWLQFWADLVEQPNNLFNEGTSGTTLNNLWFALRQAGLQDRDGWNREFIEATFGVAIAERVRGALKREWRKYWPTLPSERPEADRSSYPASWALGLAGVVAEAEELGWVSRLSLQDIETAIRYAPIQLNGFPAWLLDIVRVAPERVDAILGSELTWELNQPAELYSTTLQNVNYAQGEVASVFLPRLEKWVSSQWTAAGPTLEGKAKERMARAIDALLVHCRGELHERLQRFASVALDRDGVDGWSEIWLPALVRLSPANGVKRLEDLLACVPREKNGKAVALIGALFSEGRRHAIDFSDSEFEPELLVRLVRLVHAHVRIQDDVVHSGAYSPDARDYAERGRHSLMKNFLDLKGPQAWREKLRLAQVPEFLWLKDYIFAQAEESLAAELDNPFPASVIAALFHEGELVPQTDSDMHALLVDRLDDLADLMRTDTSPRETWARTREEREMRRLVAREFKLMAHNAYTVDQEAVTADEKETDIRLRSMQGPQAVIELKVGENHTGPKLVAAIADQLVVRYMASPDTAVGCLMVTVANPEQRWQIPDIADLVDVDGLKLALEKEAKRASDAQGGGLRVLISVLDLRPRLSLRAVKSGKR